MPTNTQTPTHTQMTHPPFISLPLSFSHTHTHTHTHGAVSSAQLCSRKQYQCPRAVTRHAVASVFGCAHSHKGERREGGRERREREREASSLTKLPSCVWRVDAKECGLRTGPLVPLRNAPLSTDVFRPSVFTFLFPNTSLFKFNEILKHYKCQRPSLLVRKRLGRTRIDGGRLEEQEVDRRGTRGPAGFRTLNRSAPCTRI